MHWPKGRARGNRARIAREPVDACATLCVIGLTAEADMPDEVRARLHKGHRSDPA